MRVGIRGRILLLALGIGIPLALVGVFALGRMWTVGRSQLDDSVKQQSELAAIAFERWVDAQRQPLITIAAVAAARKGSLPFDDNLQYVVKTRPYWIDLRIVDTAGKTQLVQPANVEPPPSALTDYLLAETRSRKSWVLVTDRTHDESKPIFALAVPIEGGGAVIARVDGTAITGLFSDIQLPERAVIGIFDSQRRRLYRKQTSGTSFDSDLNSSPLFSALGGRRVTVVELESPYDQVLRVYGVARAGATDFVVSVGVPSASLYEPMRRQLTRYLFFSLLALGCAVFAAILLQRNIVRPVHRLRTAAMALGDGDLTARAPINSAGEIGELGAAFNLMAMQIKEREERLTELDRLKSEFVSSVSHELRTPLTTIKTLTHVLQRTRPSDEERGEYLETIAAECDRQSDLVTNLLDLSRIESGAYKLELGQIDAVEIVSTCARLEKHVADTHRQILRAELPETSVGVVANRATLRRILCTLIENAIKYTPDFGEITLAVLGAGNEIGICIKDNGCGISKEDLPHIFERFFQGRMSPPAPGQEFLEETSGGREQPGVGLGSSVLFTSGAFLSSGD